MIDKFVLAILMVVIAIVYTLTTCPGLPGGDSGELITAAYSLSVAHPPGYPLYTLLAHLASLVAIGSVGLRINLFSALCQLLAAGALFILVARLTKDRWSALVAAGLFAFSPLVWRYAVVAEIFALHNLLVVILLILLHRVVDDFSQERLKSRHIYLLFFGFGLALCNHQIIVFYGLILGLWFLWQRLVPLKVIGQGFLWLLLGLTPYLYLVFASHIDNAIITGGDTSSWSGFWQHVLRSQYGTLTLLTKGEHWSSFATIGFYLWDSIKQTSYVGIVLAVSGLYFVWSNGEESTRLGLGKKSLPAALSLAWLFYLVAFHSLATLPKDSILYFDIISRFWQQANLALFVFAGIGFSCLPRWRLRPFIASALVIWPLVANYQAEDQSSNRVLGEFADQMVLETPDQAIILSSGDVYTNTFRYLLRVEKRRQDIVFLDRSFLYSPWYNQWARHQYPHIKFPGDFLALRAHETYFIEREGRGYTLEQFIDANAKFPVMAAPIPLEQNPLSDRFQLVPIGFLYQISPKADSFDLSSYQLAGASFDRGYPFSTAFSKLRKGSFEWSIAKRYFGHRFAKAQYLLNQALSHQNHQATFRAAVSIYSSLAQVSEPSPPLGLYKDWGIALYNLKSRTLEETQDLIHAFKRYTNDPLSRHDPEYPKLIQVLNGFNEK